MYDMHKDDFRPAIPITKNYFENPIFGLDNFAPDTRWGHLKPCGVYFNEVAEFNRALECVNENVYPFDPIEERKIPRCFVVTVDSPEVSGNGIFNYIYAYGGGIVGYFDDRTDTMFIIENVDAAMIYRHELQHLFLQIHDGYGGGHYQDIWQQCEPPSYNPPTETKIIGSLIYDLKEESKEYYETPPSPLEAVIIDILEE